MRRFNYYVFRRGVRGRVRGGGFEGIAFIYGKFRNLVVKS